MALDRNAQIAAEKRERMSEIEAAYLRAKEYRDKGPMAEDAVKVLQKIRSMIRMMDYDSNYAMRTVGRLQQLLIDTFEWESVIEEYEGIRASLKMMFPPREKE